MERRVILLNAAFYLCVSWLVIFLLLGFCRFKSADFCTYFPNLQGTFMKYMIVLTMFNIIIGCILFFSYLPHYHHYKSGNHDDAMIKTMHQVIQAWRGLSTVSVILYVMYLIYSKDNQYAIKGNTVYSVRIIEYILFLILGVICGLSYADYSIAPTTTPSVFPMPLPANPLLAPLNTFPMARTHPTALPMY